MPDTVVKQFRVGSVERIAIHDSREDIRDEQAVRWVSGKDSLPDESGVRQRWTSECLRSERIVGVVVSFESFDYLGRHVDRDGVDIGRNG